MQTKLLKIGFLLSSLGLANAGNISINIQTNPELSPKHLSYSKQLELELFDLSPKLRLEMMKHLDNAPNFLSNIGLPSNKELGMANVPVLDQGRHGSCVTFAVTAALDALAQLGNYYSQLCFLQLGSYLYNQGMGLSGWDGLNGTTALKRIDTYGLMNLNQEKLYGCGGLKAYPVDKNNTGEMSVNEYQLYAKKPNYTYKSIIVKGQNNVQLIKESLNKNNRLVVGVFLPKPELGVVGAVARYHYFNDTWALTDVIKNEIKTNSRLPGHMMVITGYNDNYVAKDDLGREHKGLFILRNSWGKYVGDAGNFYMTYDYMNTLAHDVFELKSPVS